MRVCKSKAGRRSDTLCRVSEMGYSRIFSVCVLLGLVITAVLAPVITAHDPAEQNLELRFSPPLKQGHLLGTDSLGRDIFSRLLFGGRSALLVGTVSCSIALLLGAAIGLPAAFGPRWLESGLMLLTDGLLAMPTILMAVAVVAVFGYGLFQVMIAMGIVFSPVIARLLRAELQKAGNRDYVEAEYLVNRSPPDIFFTAILPQVTAPLAVQLTSLFAASVSIEASLSFLGIGVQPPMSSWGIMLDNARDFLLSAPWLAFPPGIALALTVYALNTLGDAVNERSFL